MSGSDNQESDNAMSQFKCKCRHTEAEHMSPDRSDRMCEHAECTCRNYTRMNDDTNTQETPQEGSRYGHPSISSVAATNEPLKLPTEPCLEKDQYGGILLKKRRNTTLTPKDNIVPKSYDETTATVSNANELIIKDEYANLVPPISEQEYESIRQSMKDNEQWVPIIVNAARIILDGYNRFRACQELQIVPRIIIREFEDSLKEKQFIIQINRNRRQLTPFQRVELEYKYQTIQSDLAKKRMSEAGKTGAEKRWKREGEIDASKKPVNEDGVIQNYTTLSNASELTEKTKAKGRVIDISAKNAQVSPATYNKGINIIKLDPSQEILSKLRTGKVSIHKAYGQLKTKQKPQQHSIVNVREDKETYPYHENLNEVQSQETAESTPEVTDMLLHDIDFLRELGDSKMGEIAGYELSQMYDIPLHEIEKLVKLKETKR
jgi:hypothetical protein